MTDQNQKRSRTGITAITIENFKGIGEAVTVPLRPITLLFGANSSGKSTVLQAMHYAREVLENLDPDPDRTTLGGDTIDLGGFQSLVHRHDLDREITITLHMTGKLESSVYLPDEIEIRSMDNIYEPEELDVNMLFGPKKPHEYGVHDFAVRISTKWDDQLNRAQISSYEVLFDDEPFGHIFSESDSRPKLKIYTDHPFFEDEKLDRLRELGGIMITIRDAWPSPSVEGIVAAFDRLSPEEKVKLFPELKEKLERQKSEPSDDTQEPSTEEKNPSKGFLPTLKELCPVPYSSLQFAEDADNKIRNDDGVASVLSQLLVGAKVSVLGQLRSMRYLGPIRTVPPRNHVPLKRRDESRWSDGLGAWDTLLRSTQNNDRASSLVEKCSDYLNNVLGLEYTMRRADQIRLDADGEIMAELRLLTSLYDEKDSRHFLQRIWNPLNSLPRVPAIQLHDEKNDIDVEPHDIGVGVSQTIPVVVGAIEDNCSIFAVEQPELHVHPAVQCNMGDLFIREAIGDNENNRVFLLETHSEHLVLRIMRRMRETFEDTLPPGIPSITPDDVSIILVEVVEGRTIMREMPLNERGELVKAWPGGFFEEGLRETL